MNHEARVTDARSVSGDDASDYSLTVGAIVTVVGFIEQPWGPMAVIADRGAYVIVPYWLLEPEPIKVPA